MPAITLVFLVLSVISVFVIAAVVIGREARRLDAVAPRVVYQIEVALDYVANALPEETQARLTLDELRELLIGHMNWLSDRNLVPIDVIDRRQDIDAPLVVDETLLAAHLLNEAAKRGVDVLDDVDVIHVLDAHNAYFAAIGAVGPQADSI